MRGWTVYGVIAVLSVLIDQAIKYAVETRLAMHEQVDVLPFLALYRAHNTGIAFSMFSNIGSVGLAVLTIGIIVFVSWIAARTEPGQVFARLGFALIVGGAIGNLIDRVWLGYVVDYVLFHLPGWSFAIFNLADAFISMGAALVIFEEFLGWWRGRGEEEADRRD
ncbi:signal peptidase II [Mesorhizobium sp. CAU 1741]|uniref:signal peptidase II n=1 Tax=Mesorhizobium sp. CAU 1741 TaxID=3140366 RepID=UPI00325BB094